MIKMKSPSLVVNSNDVPGPNYKMWETVNAMEGMSASQLLGEIIRVNRAALELESSQLLNVVINCHGGPGALYVGGLNSPPVDMGNVGVFGWLRHRNLGTIWLVACNAARGTEGKQFCQALSQLSGCQVVAADETQDVGVWGSIRIVSGRSGLIDEFEGTVYSFTVAGGMRAIDPHEAIYTILE